MNKIIKGDVIDVLINFEKKIVNIALVPEDIDIDVIYEDQDIIAVNKPSGLVIHPGINNEKGTLANALVYHFDNLSDISVELVILLSRYSHRINMFYLNLKQNLKHHLI